jgi:hypothetical protein
VILLKRRLKLTSLSVITEALALPMALTLPRQWQWQWQWQWPAGMAFKFKSKFSKRFSKIQKFACFGDQKTKEAMFAFLRRPISRRHSSRVARFEAQLAKKVLLIVKSSFSTKARSGSE